MPRAAPLRYPLPLPVWPPSRWEGKGGGNGPPLTPPSPGGRGKTTTGISFPKVNEAAGVKAATAYHTFSSGPRSLGGVSAARRSTGSVSGAASAGGRTLSAK